MLDYIFMSKHPETRDYEKLTVSELDAAARSKSPAQRRQHLDQAGVFAALGEKTRGYALNGS